MGPAEKWVPPAEGGATNSWPAGIPDVAQPGNFAPRMGGLPGESPAAGWPVPMLPQGAEHYLNPAEVAEFRHFEPAEILAQVGSSWILASDVRPGVQEILTERQSQFKLSPDELRTLEKMTTARVLDQLIEVRLLFLAARLKIPKERLPELERRVHEHFEQEELPRRLREAKLADVAAYQARLQALGSSLERERRLYFQRAVASQWLQQQIGTIPEPDPEQLLRYYYEHLKDFETPARACWEELSVQIPRYSDGEEARRKLAQLGNWVLEGMSFAEAVARQSPEEPLCQTERRDWIAQGSMLVDPELERVIFGLPVGAMSQIIRVNQRFYIVRVLERQEAQRTPFEQAQAEIRRKILEEERRNRIRNYLGELRRQTPVWTVFDEDPEVLQWRRLWQN